MIYEQNLFDSVTRRKIIDMLFLLPSHSIAREFVQKIIKASGHVLMLVSQLTP